MDPIVIEYVFNRDAEDQKSYRVELDPETFALLGPEPDEAPEWAELDNHRCEECPLADTGTRYCPIAANVAVVAEDFRDDISHRETSVAVTTPERTYTKTVPVQQGLFGLMGLIMATSACPHMSFLRPMARFHLPFASPLETSVRSVSMFLLRRYVEARQGGQSTFDLSQLVFRYGKLRLVNRGMAERLRQIGDGDAGANAIVILHAVGSMLSYSISEDFSEIEALFAPLH